MSWPTWPHRRATPTTTSSSLKQRRLRDGLPAGLNGPAGGLFVVMGLLAGCGASAKPAIPVARPAGAARVVVAALGDSITAGSPAWDPAPAVRARVSGGADRRSQYEYWAEQAQPRLSFRNCGVFGERTDQIARRLDGCARGAAVLIVQGGINDIAQGRSVQAAAADLNAMVRRGRAGGRRVLLVEVLPWTRGHPRADAPIRELNRLIHGIGARRHVSVLPWHDALEDPAEPGVFRPDLTADGDHPSVTGYRLLGRIAAERLAAAAPR